MAGRKSFLEAKKAVVSVQYELHTLQARIIQQLAHHSLWNCCDDLAAEVNSCATSLLDLERQLRKLHRELKGDKG